MNPKATLVIFAISFLLFQCNRDKIPLDSQQPDPGTEPPPNLSEAQKLVVQSSNNFGFDLFQEIVSNEPDTCNLFISPLSVSLALGMTLNGANGQTQTDMEQTLGFEEMSSDQINQTYKVLMQNLLQLDPKVLFEIANSIWYRNTFHVEQTFLDVNVTYFDSEVRSADFGDPQTIDAINQWVDDKTHGKIDQIINNIDPYTVMFLINALYFNGTWTYEFDPENTESKPFYLADGTEMTCQMMEQRMEHAYLFNDDFKAIDLPYGDGDFSMMIILPEPDKSIDEIISMITPENWNIWMNSFQKDSIDLSMPKFKVEYKKKLKDDLTNLGMGVAFDQSAADFTKINNDIMLERLYISDVLHKTFVKVDEEGTEAAAVTVVIINVTSIPEEEQLSIIVDRPFIFVIHEHTYNSILFMGRIMQPVWEE